MKTLAELVTELLNLPIGDMFSDSNPDDIEIIRSKEMADKVVEIRKILEKKGEDNGE